MSSGSVFPSSGWTLGLGSHVGVHDVAAGDDGDGSDAGGGDGEGDDGGGGNDGADQCLLDRVIVQIK